MTWIAYSPEADGNRDVLPQVEPYLQPVHDLFQDIAMSIALAVM